MYLKSLTLRGFKSFASTTTLRFEPGITCVVGPNGSGKSNIVDALAWVMGEQGAKTLRGGKMEDVIFAGTAGRPALGRAEVELSIDNSDGALPIDYAEVSLRRLMFRSGSSEYAINGTPCRLLDIQELLSDSGIGREMHVVVGQGQLDAVLAATPEDRRGFVEEAAGILKHRKRKEKALRKLESMAANLARLGDLTTELRRQLGPLGRQAEVARRAASVQAELRDARLRLLADDLGTLRGALETELRDEAVVRARRGAVEQELAAARTAQAELEAAAARAAPRVAQAQETWYRLSALEERCRGTGRLASERHRHLSAPEQDMRAVRDPEEIEAEVTRIGAEEVALATALDAERAVLATRSGERERLEAALADEERALLAAARAVADRREGLARLSGQLAAVRGRVQSREAEIDRCVTALAEATDRASAAEAAYAVLQEQVGALDAGEVALDARHESAAAALAAATDQVAGLLGQERELEREVSAWGARREALALGLAGKDGAETLLRAADRLPGLLGPVATVLSVEPGYEAAVAAALGPVADAVAVTAPAVALAALELLEGDDGGRAGLLVGGGGAAESAERAGAASLPTGARWAGELASAPEPLRAALSRLLHRVAVVADLADARALVERDPTVRAVTMDGAVFAADWVAGGSAKGPSALEVRAALDEAEARLAAATHAGERLRFALAAATDARQRAQAELDEALRELHESDARMAAAAEELARLGSVARPAAAEAERLREAMQAAEQARVSDQEELTGLAARLTAAQALPADDERASDVRDRLVADCAAARTAEVEARLSVRTGEERLAALASRAEALRRAADQERAVRARLARSRERRQHGAVLAAEIAEVAGTALARIATSGTLAARERAAAEQAQSAGERDLFAARAQVRELAAELDGLTDAVHHDELARAEQRLRIEAVAARARDDYGIEPDVLVAEYGPNQPVPVVGVDGAADGGTPGSGEAGEPAPSRPYDRATEQRRATAAERALALLGRVNPLALEEYAALEERHAYLAGQLQDLELTRRDLRSVVRDVDERIQQVFTAAYADTAREFEEVFATLFPGGEGRLVLTEPTDMLATGIDIEARPAGKKIKRLSLLSGGERSLTAIALLVAIFRARPSPFYLLDEVEAALDDVNLSRLLTLIESLRASSQLIVVTHQKRTMEIADALYGMSMRGDGVTTVISQRLRERETA